MNRGAGIIVLLAGLGVWPEAQAAAGQILSGETVAQRIQAQPASSGERQDHSGPGIPPSSGSYSIRGRVVSATTGAPLDRAEVTLSTADQNRMQLDEDVTSASGTFRFDHLGAGKYTLYGSRRGYIASGYQQHDEFVTAIVTGPNLDTSDLRFALFPDGAIEGSVVDESGDPIASAQVSLYRELQENGVARIVTASSAMTDDTGTYEFSRLRPGDYYICVSATPWYAFHPPAKRAGSGTPLPPDEQPQSLLDVAYPITFYPNATDSTFATAIVVHPGDHVQANISLHAVPAVHVRIQIPAPIPGRSFAMPQLQTEAFGAEQFQHAPYFQADETAVDQQRGTMTVEIGGIAPGHYDLSEFGPQGQLRGGSVDLTTDQTVDFNPIAGAANVSGKLAMASGQNLPDGLNAMLIPAGGQGRSLSTRVSADGSFDFSFVTSGSYELQVHGLSRSLAVAQMAASGAQVQGSRITVGSDPVLLAATLVTGSVTVNGYAVSGGRGRGGVMILLVPRDANSSQELYRRDQSDSDGSFTLNRVVPGDYILVAIEDGWTLEWGHPYILVPYLAHGVPVHVPDREGTINLPDPVPIQER